MVMEEDEIRQDREEDAAPSRISMASLRDPDPQPRRSARRGIGRSPSFSRSRERNPNRARARLPAGAPNRCGRAGNSFPERDARLPFLPTGPGVLRQSGRNRFKYG